MEYLINQKENNSSLQNAHQLRISQIEVLKEFKLKDKEMKQSFKTNQDEAYVIRRSKILSKSFAISKGETITYLPFW